MSDSLTTQTPMINLLRSRGDTGTIPQPFTRDILLLECHIAGVMYRDWQAIRHTVKPEDTLILRREPDNPHDALAIGVLTQNEIMTGYVPRAHNEPLARLMDAGKLLFAKVTDNNFNSGWLRIGIQILMRDM